MKIVTASMTVDERGTFGPGDPINVGISVDTGASIQFIHGLFDSAKITCGNGYEQDTETES